MKHLTTICEVKGSTLPCVVQIADFTSSVCNYIQLVSMPTLMLHLSFEIKP